MKVLAALAVFFAAFTASAASIVSMTPRLGTIGGGDVVTIIVDTPLQNCPICSPPVAIAAVSFGGVPARSISAFDKTITAVTPAHAAGTVDVAVSSGDVSYGTLPFTFAGYGGAIETTNYEKVLVPLLLPDSPVPGAFGAQWSSELWVSNRSQYPVEFFNDITCTRVCPALPFPNPPYPRLLPDSAEKFSTGSFDNGLLYYLQKGGDQAVDFSLHIRDVSRSKENAGTEIGVVRERDFRQGTFEILNVPLDDVSRATLRIYDTDALAFASGAQVSILSMDGQPIVASHVDLAPQVRKPGSDLAKKIPAFAAFGQIPDIRNQFAFIQTGFSDRVRIRITLDFNAHGWAFVSVTNNATQLVTTYRPE